MNIVVLCGGVGAARFLCGTADLLKNREDISVSAIVNTGDDDEFYSMFVCPDIDSILYHLSGLHDEQRGWGRKDETFTVVEALRELGEDAWFNLGDKDFALNSIRTEMLNAGVPLREATQELASLLGVTSIDIIPMCNEKADTLITTTDNVELRMQEYFVRERCTPQIKRIDFEVPTHSHPDVMSALRDADKIVIAPSNPYLSIGPILAIKEIEYFLESHRDITTVISPIVGGRAIKGPLESNMRDHGAEVSVEGIGEIYRSIASTIVIDDSDEISRDALSTQRYNVVTCNTIMNNPQARMALAQRVLVG